MKRHSFMRKKFLFLIFINLVLAWNNGNCTTRILASSTSVYMSGMLIIRATSKTNYYLTCNFI